MAKLYFLTCFFFIGLTLKVEAQKQIGSTEFNAALKLYKAESFSQALLAFKKLEKTHGKEGVQAKYYVLECLAQAEDWEGVVKQSKLIKALELPPVNRFNYWVKTGDAYFSLGELEKAIENYTDACAVAEAYKGITPDELSIAYAGLGDVAMELGEFEKAVNNHSKALQLAQKLDSNSISAAESMSQLALALKGAGELKKALKIQQKAYNIYVTAKGENHPTSGILAVNLATTYSDLDENKQAMVYFSKALLNVENNKQGNSALAATIHNNLGICYQSIGDYREAKSELKTALSLRKALYKPGHSLIQESYNNLAAYFEEVTLYDSAIYYGEIALKGIVFAKGLNTKETATILSNLGLYYQKDGNYEESQNCFNKAIAIQQAILPADHPDLATSYHNLASLLKAKGSYNRALEYYEKTLAIDRLKYGNMHRYVANDLNSIGSVYAKKEAWEQAIEAYSSCLEIREKVLKPNHSSIATTYSNLGNVYAAKGDAQTAISYYQKALLIDEKKLGKNSPSYATSLLNLAITYSDMDSIDKGYKLMKQVFQIRELNYKPNHPDIINALNHLASFSRGKAESKTYTLLAIKRNLIKGNKLSISNLSHYPEAFKSVKRYALQLAESKNKDSVYKALNLLKLADTLADKLSSYQSLEGDRITAFSRKRELAAMACVVFETAGKLGLKTEVEDIFYYLEKSKAGVLTDALNEIKAKQISGLPKQVLEEHNNCQNRIIEIEKQLLQIHFSKLEKDSLKRLRLQESLFNSRRSFDSLTLALELKYPAYRSLKSGSQQVTAKKISESLNKSQALVNYFISDSGAFAIQITSKEVSFISLPKSKNINRLVRGYLNTLKYGREASELKDLLLLNQLLIEPVTKASKKNGINELIIIPEGILCYLPWEAIPTRLKGSKIKRYLVDDYAISYHLSAGLWVRGLALKPNENTVNKSVLAIAPIKDFASPGDFLVASCPDLPATEAEVKRTTKAFSDFNFEGSMMILKDANEENFKNKDLGQFSYIHIATHGYVNADFPELSGLVLSADSTGRHDGLITTGELFGKNLSAELVTLSACETGLGKLAKGEGILGLNRALFHAGAKATMVSLWKVSDAGTAELMVDFYAEILKGKPKAQALRNAKIKLRKAYPNPFYWAPFVMNGSY